MSVQMKTQKSGDQMSTVLLEKEGKVARLIMNRPDKLNAFNKDLHRDFMEALQNVKKDSNIRALVITGAGRAFNSGQDLSDTPENMDYGEILRKTYNPLLENLLSLEIPVIAAVNGVAAGAGFSLALACDFRLAHEKASFVQAFINVGLVPDSGSLYFLPRLVGYAKALELAVFGEKISAEEAYRLGIVNKVIPAENWEQEVMTFAENLANKPTKAIGLIKRYMKLSFHSTLSEMLEYEAMAQRIAGFSEDHQEGIRAFLEKRKPEFKGK